MIAEKWMRVMIPVHLIRVFVEVDGTSYIMVWDINKYRSPTDFVKFICVILKKPEYEKYLIIMEPSHVLIDLKTLQEGDTLKLVTRQKFQKLINEKKMIYPVKEIKFVEEEHKDVPETWRVQDNIQLFYIFCFCWSVIS